MKLWTLVAPIVMWPALTASETITIGIWDTGVDVEVFPDQLHVNPDELIDGQDTDGNGFIDDVHGIAFDQAMLPHPALLQSLWDDAERFREARATLQAMQDRAGGLKSEAVLAFRAKARQIGREQTLALVSDGGLYDFYCHGTHVAGIAVSGNPAARILVARFELDDTALKTPEWAEQFVSQCRAVVDYFRDHGVRVANLSWGWDRWELEANLAEHAFGEDDVERRQVADEIFGILEAGLREIITEAPDILFVNAAGKVVEDRENYRWIPGVFELPNLIVVGAVDSSGNPAPFSQHGPHVRLHANGLLVESVVPGGHRMRLSGTSMAAPQVTNLAAKLLARRPALQPSEVIELMRSGSTPREMDGRPIEVLNPEESLRRLELRGE